MLTRGQREKMKKRKNRQMVKMKKNRQKGKKTDKKKRSHTKKKTDWKINKKKTADKKGRQTHKKKKNRQTFERENSGIIFASLYTIIKNKMGDIFLTGQNQCHITGVKKSYFCHTFHLRSKKVFWWRVGGWKVTLVSVCVHFLKLLDTQRHRHRNGHRAWQL